MSYKFDYGERAPQRPKLKTDRAVWKLIIFTVLTCGIYPILFFIPFSFDLDIVAPRRDGGKTMNFLLAYVLSLFTCSSVLYVWLYQITERVEEALRKRKIDYNFSTNDFWIFGVFGWVFLIGSWIYYHKLCKAMNLLCADYNENPDMN